MVVSYARGAGVIGILELTHLYLSVYYYNIKLNTIIFSRCAYFIAIEIVDIFIYMI